MALLTFLRLVALLSAAATLLGCAEVTRPTPSRHAVEEVQLAALMRHPQSSYNEERAMRVFIRLLQTLPRLHGRTYPFLGFNWWVSAAGHPVVDQVWYPSPAADRPLSRDVQELAGARVAWANQGRDSALQPGDVILGVQGMDIPVWMAEWNELCRSLREVLKFSLPGSALVKVVRWSAGVRQEAAGLYRGGPVQLLIARGETKRQVTLYPMHLPAEFGLLVVGGAQGNDFNAYAAPGLVMVTSKLVNLCRTDDELAIVLGHELGHQAQGHQVRRAGQLALGKFLTQFLAAFLSLPPRWPDGTPGSLAGVHNDLKNLVNEAVISAFSRDDEREADAYGLWYAYQAGYNVRQGSVIWEKLAASAERNIFDSTAFTDSHPPALERLARLRQLAELFAAGQAATVFAPAP